MSCPAWIAASASAKRPPSEKLSGVDVEDADHLRLIEPDDPLAERQRRTRRGEICPGRPGCFAQTGQPRLE